MFYTQVNIFVGQTLPKREVLISLRWFDSSDNFVRRKTIMLKSVIVFRIVSEKGNNDKCYHGLQLNLKYDILLLVK